MSISFVRVDDRMIHGQTVTRWSLEYPCTGLIAVNDAAAKNPVLKGAYKSASDKKTFVWGVDEFIAKSKKVIESKDKPALFPAMSRPSSSDPATIVPAQSSSATTSPSPRKRLRLSRQSPRPVMK